MAVRYVDNEPPPSPSHMAEKPKSPPCAVDSSSVSQRLQKELMALMMTVDKGVSAFPEGENIFSWIGTIVGGKETPYDGLSYKLSLKFPLNYPFKPPLVKFETPCFHPNVDQCGNICLDILQNMWSSAYDCRTVLLSIQSLLEEPNVDSPLNNYAATLWSSQEGQVDNGTRRKRQATRRSRTAISQSTSMESTNMRHSPATTTEVEVSDFEARLPLRQSFIGQMPERKYTKLSNT